LGAEIRDVSHPSKKKCVESKVRPLPTNGWRLNYAKFEWLNELYRFTIEGGYDPLGLNHHDTLPFYSEHDSFLDHDIYGQSIFCNPP
jgi:hypothetical protein